MSYFRHSALFLALIAACGCSDDYSNTQAYYEQKAPLKPIVAVVPVIDGTHSTCTWDLSSELSSELTQRLVQRNRFFLVDPHQVKEKTKKFSAAQNPFGTDIAWVKRAFSGDEFVVFMELVEHQEVLQMDRKKPCDPQTCSADFNMTMRVRVFDLRGSEAKVVLQEIVHDSHFIPRPFTERNFLQVPWGHESFSISPVGLAHEEFTKQLASRIEDYIYLSM
jgi:hypothetical protein